METELEFGLSDSLRSEAMSFSSKFSVMNVFLVPDRASINENFRWTKQIVLLMLLLIFSTSFYLVPTQDFNIRYYITLK